LVNLLMIATGLTLRPCQVRRSCGATCRYSLRPSRDSKWPVPQQRLLRPVVPTVALVNAAPAAAVSVTTAAPANVVPATASPAGAAFAGAVGPMPTPTMDVITVGPLKNHQNMYITSDVIAEALLWERIWKSSPPTVWDPVPSEHDSFCYHILARRDPRAESPDGLHRKDWQTFLDNPKVFISAGMHPAPRL
jgi:hypothetical protein